MSLLTLFFRILLLFVACSFTPIYAVETDVLANISAQIAQHAVIRADFTQTKQMTALKRPLITHGKFVYSRDYGVLWQIEQPYHISYLLGEDKMIEISGDGVPKERNARDIPGLGQVSHIFRALLGAKLDTLKNTFDIAANGDASKWEIQLIPKQAQLKQFLTTLNLNGSQFVENIQIAEAGGDSTRIQFRNSKSVAALNDNELQLFSGITSKP
ncbi:MAG TPA: outer membrane lipoprotein carrier protein LolA [Methyloradius sp.]